MFSRIKKFFTSSPKFYGHSLEEWNYLGYTILGYSNSDHKGYAHFFVSKTDESKRSFHIEPNSREWKSHSWMQNVNLWMIGEFGILSIVLNFHSNYAVDYAKKLGFAWDASALRYVKLKPETTVEGNLVTVDFTKK